jgi:hypothetical protein
MDLTTETFDALVYTGADDAPASPGCLRSRMAQGLDRLWTPTFETASAICELDANTIVWIHVSGSVEGYVGLAAAAYLVQGVTFAGR